MSVILKQSIVFGVLVFILRPLLHLLLWEELEMTELLLHSLIMAVAAGVLFYLVLKLWYRKKGTNK